MQTKIFLINLDRDVERLRHMQSQALSIGFDFERIPAINGRAVPDWLRAEFVDDKRMSDGQVGCYASHLKAAHMIVSRELNHAIVLEDDAVLDPSFREIAAAAIKAAPADWDYIHLSSSFKKAVIRTGRINDAHIIVRYTDNPANTAAYILSNRGARKWLAPMPRVRPNDLDNRFAWQQRLKVLGVYPAIVRQRKDVKSTISRSGTRPHWEPGALSMLGGALWHARTIGVRNYAAGVTMNVINSLRKRIDGKVRVSVISGR